MSSCSEIVQMARLVLTSLILHHSIIKHNVQHRLTGYLLKFEEPMLYTIGRSLT